MQVITQAVVQATKAAVIAVREAETPAMPKIGSSVLKKLLFNWKSPGKFIDLSDSDTKVENIFLTNNILLTNSYNIQESEKVQIILN